MPPILALSGYLYYSTLQGADILSTLHATKQAGVVEGNPLLRSPWQAILIKGAAAYGMGKLESRIPPRRRWLPRLLLGLGYGGIVYHNLTTKPK